MFTTTRFSRALTLTLGLVSGAAGAQSFTYPQPGFPQPGYPQPAYQQPVGYAVPAVVPEPPVRLGFQFAMTDYGMNVAALRDGGLAHQIGLLPGDIIVQMNEFQITDWNQYCLALHDAIHGHAGAVEMWLYRPTPAGYEMQYVAFTIHEEVIEVVVPCSYHFEKCHAPHVTCWAEKLVHLNHCWKDHHHHGGKTHNHHGLDIHLLGKGLNVNFNKHGLNHNLGNLLQKHGNGNFGGQFGNFKPHDFKNQVKHLNGVPNFQKHIQPQIGSGFKPKFNTNSFPNFGNSMKSQFKSSHGNGSSMRNFSSQFSRSSGGSRSNGGGSMMKSFGGFGKK